MLLKDRAGAVNDQQRLLEEAEKSCARLSVLMRESDSRPRGGKRPLNRSAIDLRTILSDAIRDTAGTSRSAYRRGSAKPAAAPPRFKPTRAVENGVHVALDRAPARAGRQPEAVREGKTRRIRGKAIFMDCLRRRWIILRARRGHGRELTTSTNGGRAAAWAFPSPDGSSRATTGQFVHL